MTKEQRIEAKAVAAYSILRKAAGDRIKEMTEGNTEVTLDVVEDRRHEENIIQISVIDNNYNATGTIHIAGAKGREMIGYKYPHNSNIATMCDYIDIVKAARQCAKEMIEELDKIGF